MLTTFILSFVYKEIVISTMISTKRSQYMAKLIMQVQGNITNSMF